MIAGTGMHFIWLFMVLVVIAFLVAVTVGIVYMATAPARHAMAPHPGAVPPGAPPAPGKPLDILARRFASGEITADDYERARKLLKEDTAS